MYSCYVTSCYWLRMFLTWQDLHYISRRVGFRWSWLISYVPRCIKQNAHICLSTLWNYIHTFWNESYQRDLGISWIPKVYMSFRKRISRKKNKEARQTYLLLFPIMIMLNKYATGHYEVILIHGMKANQLINLEFYYQCRAMSALRHWQYNNDTIIIIQIALIPFRVSRNHH